MQDRKYHKIRLSEAKKDYIKLLKDHLPMEILSIGIPTIPNIILGKIYYTITSALLYEFGFLVIVFGGLFFWKSLRVVPERIYNEQQGIISSKQKAIEFLEEQQKPKLRIDFDGNNSIYFCDTSRSYIDAQTNKKKYVQLSHIWRIAITNLSSSETIENVEVKLINVDKYLSGDGNKLPWVRLKFTDDHKREQSFVNINPNDCVFVDVVECFMKSVQVKENIFYVQHIEKNQNYTELSLFFDNIDKAECQIKIRVTGKNIPFESKNFTIGLQDNMIKMCLS